jgi:mono/diheme cytochrome c family protein
MTSTLRQTLLAAALLGLAALSPLCPAAPAQESDRGKALYDQWCAGCHGETGAGDGEAAAFMLPRPRDFTRAVYQIRTTASGELPTDEDLRRVLDEGMPGTAMPGWREKLPPGDRDAVLAYIKRFSRFFQRAAPEPVALGRAPGSSAEGLEEGRRVFEQLECFKCHGQQGRGDGPSAPTLTDDWDHPIRAADLARNWRFNGGGTVEQIYARLRTGLDGTPMPSFSDAIASNIITEEQLWHVAQYVRSLSPEREPEVREVIRAGLADGPLPADVADSAWNAVEPVYLPLVGQIIVPPRWFAPMVDGVWVQALHDGERLALRLVWHDPSQSPDPAWDEWLGRVAAAMTDADGPVPTSQGPDRLHVQLPPTAPVGADRPYFLGGAPRDPVVLWTWTSDQDRVAEGTARGLGTFQPYGGDGTIAHSARYDEGAWQLQVVRPLAPADSTRGPGFTPGTSVPIAFFAADGSNGEGPVRGAVSAWYAIYLDVPTPARVYVMPVVAVLVTAGLGVLVIKRAQRGYEEA